jgi:hypothetical protein
MATRGRAAFAPTALRSISMHEFDQRAFVVRVLSAATAHYVAGASFPVPSWNFSNQMLLSRL